MFTQWAVLCEMWRAQARCMVKNQLAAGVHKIGVKFLDLSRMAKQASFFLIREKSVGRRRQALAP